MEQEGHVGRVRGFKGRTKKGHLAELKILQGCTWAVRKQTQACLGISLLTSTSLLPNCWWRLWWQFNALHRRLISTNAHYLAADTDRIAWPRPRWGSTDLHQEVQLRSATSWAWQSLHLRLFLSVFSGLMINNNCPTSAETRWAESYSSFPWLCDNEVSLIVVFPQCKLFKSARCCPFNHRGQ